MRNAYNIFYYIFFFLVVILPDKSDHRYYLFIQILPIYHNYTVPKLFSFKCIIIYTFILCVRDRAAESSIYRFPSIPIIIVAGICRYNSSKH